MQTKHYEKSFFEILLYLKSILLDPEKFRKIIEKYDLFIHSLIHKTNDDQSMSLSSTVEYILNELKKLDPQFSLNGNRNIWILKPALLSRGRGIKCFNNLTKILDYVFHKKIPYVCQKYIENPLIIKKKNLIFVNGF